jgi:hypothetical protein
VCASTSWVEVPAGTHTVSFKVEQLSMANNLYLDGAAATVVFTPDQG